MALSCGLASAAEPVETGTSPGWSDQLASGWARVTSADAWQGPGHWRLAIAPFAVHFNYSDEHRYVWGIGAERQYDDNWLAGASFFSNSFGQPSAYAYFGHRNYGLFDRPPLFFQWSAGLMYGYKGKYEDKVPLNVNGFSPALLVGLGWQFDKQSSAAIHLLGDAGLLLQLSYDFP